MRANTLSMPCTAISRTQGNQQPGQIYVSETQGAPVLSE